MQTETVQKSVKEKPSVSSTVQSNDIKNATQKETGAEAGLPLFLQRSAPSPDFSAPPPDTQNQSAESLPVQHQCAACEKESVPGEQKNIQTQVSESEIEEPGDASQVQQQCANCEKEINPPVQNKQMANMENSSSDGFAVQLWECGEYEKPTCVQAQLDTPPSQQEQPDQALPVQSKCAACEAEDPLQQAGVKKPAKNAGHHSSMIQAEARRGIKDAGQALPHAERIQASFGRHDISHVRAKIGGEASTANRRMGALAFASGDRIGFRESPSLHLAAHEAAHIVQQREGLSLPGNVGQAGDRWERHADQVADAVTAGKSAEPVLNQVSSDSSAGKSESSSMVQKQLITGAAHLQEPPVNSGGGAGAKAEVEAEPAEAEAGSASEQSVSAAGSSEPPPEKNEKDKDCEKKDKSQNSNQQNTKQSASSDKEEATATQGLGSCYVEGAEAPPDNTPKPNNDSEPNNVEAESKTDFSKWEEADDACECKVNEDINQQAGQIPAEVSPDQESPEAAQSEQNMPADTGEVAVTAQATSREAAGDSPNADEGSSSFAIQELQRDAAITDYYAAADSLQGIPARATRLSEGLAFESGGQLSAVEAVRENNALDSIRSFMSRAASQVEDAVFYVQNEVPARLSLAADEVSASIRETVEKEKSAISSRISAARSRARSSASGAQLQIFARYVSNVRTVNTETDKAIKALRDEYETSARAISEQEETALLEVNTRFANSRKAHDERGRVCGQEAINRGQEHVDEYDKCRAGRGNDNTRNKDDGFWDGCLTVRRAQAQQKAACSVAKGVRDNMLETAQRKGFNLREQRTQKRCAVISGAGKMQETLEMVVEQLTAGLESGRSSVLAGLSSAWDINNKAVESTLQANLQVLDLQEREQRQAVNDSGYVQQLAVEQLAHTSASSLARGVGSAMDSLEITLQQLREQLIQGEVPDPDALDMILTDAQQGLASGVNALLDKMKGSAVSAEIQLLEAALNATESLASISRSNDRLSSEGETEFSTKMSVMVNAASSIMGDMSAKHVAKARDSVDKGVSSMKSMVEGFAEANNKIYEEVNKATEKSMEELNTELLNMRNKLDGKITSEAWKAAKKEQPAWKGVVAILLIILVIVLSVVVSVLTLGAGAPLLAVILVGAVVGAVTAGLIQVINNWAAGEDLSTGVVQAMVIGAVGGALGGAIGAGANGLAQAAVQGAIRAGASTATRVALNIGINLAGDMLAEGLSQGFAAAAYGQEFNWQGFVMAGGMSVASTARGGAAGAPRAAGPDSVSVSAPAPRTRGEMARGALLDLGIGMGVAGSVEAIDVATGGEFDANRFASSTASGFAGMRAISRGNRGSQSAAEPTTRTGKALANTRSRVGRARDAAFSRMEIPESSALRQRTERGLNSVENWFAGGAGGMIRNRGGSDGGQVPTRVSDGAAAETPVIRPQEVAEPAQVRRGETGEATPPRRTISDEVDTGTQANKRIETAEPVDISARARAGVDAEAPINRMSDAEISAMTNTKTQVGDVDHDVSIRRRGDEVECEICSKACASVMQKNAEIRQEIESNTTPKAQELKDGLDSISNHIKEVKSRIEGRLEEGVYQAGTEVIKLASDIANEFQSLGVRFESLGDAINTPSQIRKGDLFPLSGNTGEIRVKLLEGSDQLVKTTTEVDSGDFTRIVSGDASILAEGQQCIYVLRASDGTVLKVGKSSAGNAKQRFGKYQSASELVPGGLKLEITALKQGLSARDASALEGQLRSKLEAEGHIMPWDSTAGRLDRPGPGVPGEKDRTPRRDENGNVIKVPDSDDPTKMRLVRWPPSYEWDGANLKAVDPNNVRLRRLSPPTEADLRGLMEKHQGDVQAVADRLTEIRNYPVPKGTLYSWLSKYKIKTGDFKP